MITNSILPRWFFHVFAKTGIFLWIPEQLQRTWILEMINKSLAALTSPCLQHHQWCQQSCLVFQICYNTITKGIMGKAAEEERFFFFFFLKVFSSFLKLIDEHIITSHCTHTKTNFWVYCNLPIEFKIQWFKLHFKVFSKTRLIKHWFSTSASKMRWSFQYLAF